MSDLNSRKEKDSGRMKVNDKKTAFPKYDVSLASIPALEGVIVDQLVKGQYIIIDSGDEE